MLYYTVENKEKTCLLASSLLSNQHRGSQHYIDVHSAVKLITLAAFTVIGHRMSSHDALGQGYIFSFQFN